MAKFNSNPWKQKKLAEALRDPELSKKQAEEMADIEFQMEIAPYMNYEGPHNIEKARYRGFPSEQGRVTPGYGLGLQGVYRLPNTDTKRQGFNVPKPDGKGNSAIYFDIEPDTVNAFDVEATPDLWAHEFRHEQGQDSERETRIYDAYNAQTKDDWNQAKRSWIDWKLRTEDIRSITPAEAEADLMKEVKNMDDMKRIADLLRKRDPEREDHYKTLSDNPLFKRMK